MSPKPIQIRCLGAVALLVLLLGSARAQTPTSPAPPKPAPANPQEAGAPFLTYYPLKAEQIHPENWSLTRDRRGVLYAANVEGVVEHDGRSWRIIPVMNRRVRSVTTGADGVVYVGAEGEFGQLVPDAVGLLEYRSLLLQVPPEAREFKNVYQLLSVGGALYLNTGSHLVRTGRGPSRSWAATQADGFQKAFAANGQVYVQDLGVGLRVLKGDSLQTIEGGERFATLEMRIDALLPFNERRVLIATRNAGLFRYDETLGLEAFDSPVAPLLREHQLYCGAVLASGDFALGTRLGGVHLIDRNGRHLSTIFQAEGLPPAKVYDLLTDAQGSLWMALDRGLAHTELPLALTRLSDVQGLSGTALATLRHRGNLYCATSTGVYTLRPGLRAAFTSVGGVSAQAWHLAEVDGDLLVATSLGIYQLRGTQLVPVAGDDARLTAFYLLASKQVPGRLYVGLSNGIGILAKGPRGWALQALLPGVSGEVRWMTESPTAGPGGSVALWFGDAARGVQRALLYANAEPVIESYGTDDGLPMTDGNCAVVLHGEVVIASRAGLFAYDEPTRRFNVVAPLGAELARLAREFELLVPAADGTVWALTYHRSEGKRFWQLSGQGDAVRALRHPLGRVAERQLLSLYVDPAEAGGAVWLAGDEGLIRFDPGVRKPYLAPFRALIRKVAAVSDSTGAGIIYMGLRDSAANSPAVSNSFNSVRVEVGTTGFDHAEATEFQYRLEPLENSWGRWTRESYRDYTNLWERTYTLRVRARNAYGQTSAEDSFRFTVEPPFWRTWLAYAVYLVAFIGLGYGFLQYRIAQLEKDKRVLEQKVQERTAEVMRQKAELENAYEEIRATNEQLEEAFREIEEKNRDITDSIQYAKRIQEAILPPESEWAEALPDAFVLYKPRDIVSGDFYWMLRTDGLIYVAAVDCTGHGVPGAFMSVMGNSLLNEIIGQSGLRDPGDILSLLDRRVQQTLRQVGGTPGKSSSSKDGMEVALLCFDNQASELRFSGANRPLLYVRQGEVHEIEPDKVPIGGHAYTQLERYTTHRIGVQRGDVFYAFSDGYGDQFGGDKGRKFMVKNLKDLLLKLHDQPLTVQRDTLGQTIDQWRGQRPQIDDILILGIRT